MQHFGIRRSRRRRDRARRESLNQHAGAAESGIRHLPWNNGPYAPGRRDDGLSVLRQEWRGREHARTGRADEEVDITERGEARVGRIDGVGVGARAVHGERYRDHHRHQRRPHSAGCALDRGRRQLTWRTEDSCTRGRNCNDRSREGKTQRELTQHHQRDTHHRSAAKIAGGDDDRRGNASDAEDTSHRPRPNCDGIGHRRPDGSQGFDRLDLVHLAGRERHRHNAHDDACGQADRNRVPRQDVFDSGLVSLQQGRGQEGDCLPADQHAQRRSENSSHQPGQCGLHQ